MYQCIRGYFYNKMCGINLRFTYLLLTFLLKERLVHEGMPDGQKTEYCKYCVVADTVLTVVGSV